MPDDFDVSAKNYDKVFTFTNIGKAQRKQVHKFINKTICQNKKLSILELNCGTGEDAIYFSKKGHKVLATDISEEMIKVAKSKNNNICFLQQDINTITSKIFTEKFDLIFSNFGGLNCLSNSQFELFLQKSVTLLKPNGKLIMVVMPKHCLWEFIYFSIKGKFKKANRRNTNSVVIANVNGEKVSTWYHNPKEIVSLTEKLYVLDMIKPIGISIPPSYLESSFLSKKPFINILTTIEKLLSNKFWAKYADHYLIEFTKS